MNFQINKLNEETGLDKFEDLKMQSLEDDEICHLFPEPKIMFMDVHSNNVPLENDNIDYN